MNITISNRHWDRTTIEGLVERINRAVDKTNATVRTLESKDDLEQLKQISRDSAKEYEKRIQEQRVAINRYKNEIDTLTGRLNICGIFDRHSKKYFKKEIAKLNFEIYESENVIRKLQHLFDAQVANYARYNLLIPTPQQREKAVADHRKFVAYEYNPNIILLNNVLGENFPVANPEEFTELEHITLVYEKTSNFSYHSVSISQNKNLENEME